MIIVHVVITDESVSNNLPMSLAWPHLTSDDTTLVSVIINVIISESTWAVGGGAIVQWGQVFR